MGLVPVGIPSGLAKQSQVDSMGYDMLLAHYDLYIDGHLDGALLDGMQASFWEGFLGTGNRGAGDDFTWDTVNKKAVVPNAWGAEQVLFTNEGGDNLERTVYPGGNTTSMWKAFANATKYKLTAVEPFTGTRAGNGGAYLLKAYQVIGDAGTVDCVELLGNAWEKKTLVYQPVVTGGITAVVESVSADAVNNTRFRQSVAGDNGSFICKVYGRPVDNTKYGAGTLKSKAQVLDITATNARLYLAVKVPGGGSLVPSLSADGGAHFSVGQQVSSRAWPLDTAYTELVFDVMFGTPGNSLQLSVAADAAGAASPVEVKWWGVQLA